jgi:hypothetical protein
MGAFTWFLMHCNAGFPLIFCCTPERRINHVIKCQASRRATSHYVQKKRPSQRSGLAHSRKMVLMPSNPIVTSP